MKSYNNPLFFEPNRVWRCYLGGKILDSWFNHEKPSDGLFPENWLGSTTVASNGEHQISPTEGLSKIRGGELLVDLLKRDSMAILGEERTDLGVLCKFLDSAIRLPIQCHPDKEFSKKYFDSQYGKTESWFILETREINGEKPYILMGFKVDADEAKFKQAVKEQDIETLTNMLHKIEVKPNDAFFIPGRMPHAIGTGVMMLEVQEPSDWVVQPEEKIGDITLSKFDMWNKLDEETALNCFDYQGMSLEETLNSCQLHEKKQDNLAVIIDETITDCFKVSRLSLGKNEQVTYDKKSNWQIGIVTCGEGIIKTEAEFKLQRGDSFLLPKVVDNCLISADSELEIYWIN